ncbi:MAG: histidine phosphatase family protein [Zoogloea sp.]|nr:histidine phosphatase family protein [Zoogloea sp.]MCA0184488.1 histidine phosphatase family protein [Pseudomonadota bacterium]
MPTRRLITRAAARTLPGLLLACTAWPTTAQSPAPTTAAPAAALTPVPANSDFKELPPSPKLIRQLRNGGYVLYMRHGTTDNSRADSVTDLRLDDCSTQRVLNDDGRRVAATVGSAIRKAQIPLAEIIHSPLCRTTETVRLGFPGFKGPIRADPDLMYTANLTSEQKKPVLIATRRLVSTPPPAGSNRLIVAHAPNLADLMGYFVKPEGTVVVLQPLGEGRYEYLASISPAAWPPLLNAIDKE